MRPDLMPARSCAPAQLHHNTHTTLAPAKSQLQLRSAILAGTSVLAMVVAMAGIHPAHAAPDAPSLLIGKGGDGAPQNEPFSPGGGGGGGIGGGGGGGIDGGAAGAAGGGSFGGAGGQANGSGGNGGIGGGGGALQPFTSGSTGDNGGDIVDVLGNTISPGSTGAGANASNTGSITQTKEYYLIGVGGGGGGASDNSGGNGSDGTLTLSGASSTIRARGSVFVGGDGGGASIISGARGGNGGNGTLILANGATLIVDNTLQIGGEGGEGETSNTGGNAGSGTVNINNGKITISDGGNVVIGGTAGAGGSLGGAAGTDQLSIRQGTLEFETASDSLQIKSNGTLTFGNNAAGDVQSGGIVNLDIITNNGAIVFNQSNDEFTLSQRIDGTGTVTVNNNSRTVLSNSSNGYTGATTVNSGTLEVSGALSSSSVTVKNGGILTGAGAINTITVESGGIHNPGAYHAIGNQISGDYTLESGAILEIDVSSSNQADKVTVIGAVDINGSTLRIKGITNNNFKGDDDYGYIIIDNDGSDATIGTFGNIDNKLAFYDASVSYFGGTGNDVRLSLSRNSASLSDVAVTPNQKAVSNVLSSLPGSDGDTVRNAVLGLTTSEARHAYEQLSGDVHASGTVVNTQISDTVGVQVQGRLTGLRASSATPGARGNGLVAATSLSPAVLAGFADGNTNTDGLIAPAGSATDAPVLALGDLASRGNGASVWLQGIGGKGRVDGDGETDVTNYKWTGLVGGYDTRLSDDATIGIYFGYSDSTSRQSNRDATLDGANLLAGVYGNYELGSDWHVSGQAGWTRIATDSSRNLVFGGINRTATADYTDNSANAQIELARGFDLADNWRVEPYGGLGITWDHYGAFSETGAGSSNLSRESDDLVTGNTSLGVRFAGLIDAGNGKTLVPQFGLGWDHHLGQVSNSSTLAFEGGSSFNVSGSDRDRDTLIGNLGFALADDGGWSLYADYQPSVSENRAEHAFTAGFRLGL